MLVLRSSPASPFGRKVKLSASILGLTDRIRIVDADTLNPDDSIRQQNPLGKIPALILESGEVLYDSRVIVDYLDHLAGGGVIPNGPERYSALRDQALADGIMDAALLQVYEGRFRPEDRHEPKWVSHQADKVRRGLDYAEAHLAEAGQPLHIGQIALACALGYLDLRFGGRWRESYPRLVAWLADFESRVPAYAKTRVTP
ncbi:glutathione S-transferase N-terminal domain-containing protein [Microvirga terrae]|uniref:Glutathione S-transferase N-terminal domain-containing protein n=1 Tax=Microvirga terrae TaxID=2740529 RepID=A0ABY5RUU0_9HYPH|nr:glutathione S-transferase N-terminal domain-containing protein [Microvirga terrae]UVF20788.1 glutathione S-transferase N-terminal domain-containing protein [Microvirga terrae]